MSYSPEIRDGGLIMTLAIFCFWIGFTNNFIRYGGIEHSDVSFFDFFNKKSISSRAIDRLPKVVARKKIIKGLNNNEIKKSGPFNYYLDNSLNCNISKFVLLVQMSLRENDFCIEEEVVENGVIRATRLITTNFNGQVMKIQDRDEAIGVYFHEDKSSNKINFRIILQRTKYVRFLKYETNSKNESMERNDCSRTQMIKSIIDTIHKNLISTE